MPAKKLYLLLITLVLCQCAIAQQEVLVLKGGTIIDVTDFGNSERDISNATVVIEGGRIKAAGSASSVKVPKGAKVIDVSGKYIVPGLIDCFGIINDQAYANAYLYMGVTTAVMTEDNRRGKIDWTVNPSPHKIILDAYWGAKSKRVSVGGVENAGFEIVRSWSKEEIDHDIDSLGKAGVKVLLVHYAVVPAQLPAIVAACKRNKIATIGELGLSSYREAVQAGIQSFVHTSRYSADMLPDSLRKVYSTSPFGPPARAYYEYITGQKNIADDPKLLELSKLYRDHRIGLISTAGMIQYPEMEFATNPWLEPIASIIDERTIEFEPLDKSTGKPKNPSPVRQHAVPALVEIDKVFAKQGVRYITGTGTDAFGTLPGISLHNELAMLSHFGLTNRQALAAATHNFSLLWEWTSIGKVETGRDANILVLDQNPVTSLKHLKAISLLIVEGKIVDRNKLMQKP
ncbi:amidohydrolase family protein [Chryseolinea soli]|uniref:Amidohydrolase-related domain-containing protein n=1 Tax=Chryseolinea soli TaxID=2321403 RepID=A0A385SUB4_9BACT|nr:hypothetical protein [Chryseolinea soli]AYB33280.1 hypothetical protein D4L85_23030 [Chryseolinea soli]